MTQWKSRFLGCFEDIPVCLIGTFVPCYLFGQNSEHINPGSQTLSTVKYCLCGSCLPCIFHTSQRKTIRERYGLEEKPGDFLATCCCTSSCGNCQEAREIKAQGGAGGGRVTTQPR